MAKQAGIIKVKGLLDELSFYKTRDGHLVRVKGGVDRSKIMNDPSFQRTRENMSEFARAGQAGKLVRNAVRHLAQNAKDSRVVSRMVKVMMTVIKTDPVNERGNRLVKEGDLLLLYGFNFNSGAILSTTLYVEIPVTFDRGAGESTASVASFIPSQQLMTPAGTTHYKIVHGAAELDFDNEDFVFASADTGILPLDAVSVPPTVLSASLTPGSTLPVIQVLGVEFLQEVNGEFYPLKNGAHNALAIVNVNPS